MLFSLLTVGTSNELFDAVVATWSNDSRLKEVIADLQDGSLSNSKYVWHNGQLRRKDKWVVGQDIDLRKTLVKHFHESAVGGHSGVQATTKRLTTYFYWKGLRKMFKELVRVVMCVRETNQIWQLILVYFNHHLFQNKFGKISPWISLNLCILLMEKVHYW